MDISMVAFYLFGIASTIYIVHFGIYLVGANLYDIWQSRRAQKPLPTTPPFVVSVLIAAHNEELVIKRTLDSVGASTHRQLQVIVIDDASTDNTTAIVRKYKQSHPQFTLRLVRLRNNGGKGRALNYALRHYASGDLVMTLDADSIIAPHTVARAVRYFEDPSVVGIAANVQIMDNVTVLGMLQRFEHMISYRSKKTYSLLNCEFVVGGVASTYRMSTLREVGFYSTDTVTEDIGLSMKVVSKGNRRNRIVYAADVSAKTEGVTTFKALVKQRYRWKYGSMQNLIKYRWLIGSRDPRFTASLTLYRMPLAVLCEGFLLLTPVLWVYAFYITVSQQSLALFIGAYLTITVYTYITIWFDEHTPLSEKFLLGLYAPLAYFMFYLMDIVQICGIIRCAYNSRALLGQTDIGSTWQSPERIGNLITQQE